MALSFEESKKLFQQQATTPMMMASDTEPTTVTAYSLKSAAVFSDLEGWNDIPGKYKYFTNEYADENYSTVDELKNITLDPSQFNITQEKNSQYIPFQMPRKYDGFDLINTDLSIYYINQNRDAHSDIPVDVYYNDDYIRFAWLVSEFATQVAGVLKFEIHARGTNSQGQPYVWKSKSFDKLNVLQSLEDIAAGEIGLSEAELNNWFNKIHIETEVAQTAATNAQNAANRAASLVASLENGIAQEVETAVNEKVESVVDDKIADKLNNYYTKDDTYSQKEIDDAIAAVKPDGYATEDYVEGRIGDIGTDKTVVDYVTDAIDAQDITEKLGNYYTKSDIESRIGEIDSDKEDGVTITIKDYVDTSIAAQDISGKLGDYYKKTETYSQTEIDNKIDAAKPEGYATETYVDNKVAPLVTDIANNTNNIKDINDVITDINDTLGAIDKTPNAYYITTYDEPYSVNGVDYDGQDTLVLYKTNEADDVDARSYVAAHVIKGGTGGGTTSTNKLVAKRVTPSPHTVLSSDKVIIEYEFEGTNAANEDIQLGYATWKIGNKVIINNQEISTSANMPNNKNSIDLTEYIGVGSNQKLTLIVSDDVGSAPASTFWYVSVVDMKLESSFNDSRYYAVNSPVDFTFTPYGAVEKTVHFVLDGEEIGTKTISENNSGRSDSFTLPSQEHGAHLLEAYMTAEINGKTVGLEEVIDEESGEVVGYNHTIKVVKDIVWFDETSNVPVIGCATPVINAMQHNTVNIKYTVFDSSTETPTVTWSINGVPQDPETLTEKDKDGYYTYPYKASEAGTFVFTVNCGKAEPKTITVNVEELNIDVSPVTKNLAFDFNPSSNTDKLWSSDGKVSMTTSDNFDWVNGGYQIDEESGDQCFCVKAGTTATIDYKLFANDPKADGKEFKVIFKTKNIRRRDTSFLTCLNGGIGLDMKIENAIVYNSLGSLKSDYCENTIIEYEFNINKDTDMRIVMSYEDGTPSKPCEYTALSSFKQSTAQPITIGSEDCDVFIYRMKAYSSSLTDTDIMDNFIADARSADEMLARYNRNQIYTNGSLISTSASGDFNVDALMKAAPDLRYIFLEVPQFTNDKDNKIDNCTVYFRYPNGTRPQDNWDCTGVRHRGQGTSSNSYGYAGRNIDLCMDRNESLFTYTDEQGNEVNSRTITLTDTSVPTDYLNIKVNIASSENANNAEMARRYNEYQPFLRYARKKDSKVKDTMEFYNCVVFIRETGDLSIHREFNDTNWHFYAIGNVGDSKKSDDTRVNNANDPKEHVIEIADVDKPLHNFPTGKEGNAICPVGEWKPGNAAYDILHSQEYVYDDGEFESFGGATFEFRYEMDGITEEQRETNINTWRDLYKFIVTSSDAEFYAHLKDYFVVDSALYYYLFTERYTMVDNRAKNSFWHYGKVYISETEATELGETEASYYIIDNEAAAINDGYRYDLTFGYDFDTALGIDNTGDYVFSYGKEDTDYYDGSSSKPVFRAMDSTFFCRLRDLFPSEMQAMFKNREEKNAWNSNLLIAQWDNSQAQFPEELWRLDYERKYYRTYLGLSIDNSIIPSAEQTDGQVEAKTYLVGKFFGRKKYPRRAFEINQEMYFATKYFGQKALGSVFWIRGNTYGGNDNNLKQNYSLTLVPYSDMYLCMQYSSTGTPIHSVDENGKPKRIKAGESYTFVNNEPTMDFIYVYAANWIQEVADLSRCYFDDNDFSAATRLQKLVIGSTDEGYDNPNMTNILVGNNQLLEHLDLRNVSGINTVIDVSGCSNLKELYAEGTNATGVIFANGGLLHTAHLPGTIKSLSMKNLNYIYDKNFIVDGYNNLQTLIVENTPNINTYNIVNGAQLLTALRLINLNWDASYQIQDGSIFDRLLTMDGRDSSGYETDQSVLTGNAHIVVIKERQAYNYRNAWPDLIVTANTHIEQFAVTFVNDDDTILDVQYVDKGEKPVDPITRPDNPISTPTKESSVSTDYTYAGWDSEFSDVFKNQTIKATYTESTRVYTVTYKSKNNILQETSAPYGSIVLYEGDIPTYTIEETAYKYYLFDGWNQSGYVNGDKEIEAVFDSCEFTSNYFDGKDLSDMRPVEIYMMTKRGLAEQYVGDKDSILITLGDDFNYTDVDQEILIAEKTVFNGTNYVDTDINLLSEDRDFVLAIDYEMNSGNTSGDILAQCFSGLNTSGFKLAYNNGVKFQWGSSTTTPSTVGSREMLVVRHIKGEYGLHIYTSNTSGDASTYVELDGIHTMTHNVSLVFGCAKMEDGSYEDYGKGVVYWSKLWYTDLGDNVCANLAYWPHEEFIFEMCGTKRYYLSDGSGKRTSMTLLASGVLARTMPYNTSTEGGWASASLNTYLNSRIYNAFPLEWKQLMKQFRVYSSIGQGSLETSFSNCYITVPSILELDNSKNTAPYTNEGEHISFFTDNDSRICRDKNGTAVKYVTRSPNATNGSYVWYITNTGATSGYDYPYNLYHIRMMISI